MASVADVPDPVRASTLEHARIDHRVTSLRPEIAVARSFFSLGTGDAIARFIAFVATLYLARTLGPRVYGMLVVAATVMAYVGRVADCGVDQLGIHDVARNRAQLTDLVSAYVGARLLVSGTIVVLLVAVAGVRISSQPTIFLCSYGYADPRDAGIANALTLDEARRVASNIATLPTLLGKG